MPVKGEAGMDELGKSDLDRSIERYMHDEEFCRLWKESEQEDTICDAIVRARIEQNLSQTQLAEASGIDKRVLSRIETGRNLPSLTTLSKIAKGLGKVLVIGFADPGGMTSAMPAANREGLARA